jgi:glycosyltransferase involved in cell wall biosynthesis
MKIAIDISQIIYGTGVSVYTRNLVSHLVKMYPHDHFLLFGGSLRRRRELNIFTNRLKTESKFYSMPPKFVDLLWNSFHIYPIENIIGQVDVVHTSDWAEPPSKLPKVTTVHDLIPFKYPQTTQDGVRVAHKKRLAWVSKESALILAVSQATKVDLIDLLKIDDERIIVTPEGVESFYSPQSPSLIETVKSKFQITGDYIFSLSTLEPRKNQQRLIEAYKIVKEHFPGLKLVLGGRTGWGEGLRPTEGVIMPGYIPDADLPALYSGCLAYVLPSLYEGFSLSHLQAMACGSSVVGSQISSMPEVIGQAGQLVDPISVADIAKGIIKAIKGRGLYGQKAIKRARLFSWEETAKLTHDAYIKAVGLKNNLK